MTSSGTPISLAPAPRPDSNWGFCTIFSTWLTLSACPISTSPLSLVLPTLDYCSSVWDPAAVTLISQLESVQSFAARLVTKCWSSPPDQLIHSLSSSTLQARRKKQTVMVCRRILSGHFILPPRSSLLTHILIQGAITPTLSPLCLPEHPSVNHLFLSVYSHVELFT